MIKVHTNIIVVVRLYLRDQSLMYIVCYLLYIKRFFAQKMSFEEIIQIKGFPCFMLLLFTVLFFYFSLFFTLKFRFNPQNKSKVRLLCVAAYSRVAPEISLFSRNVAHAPQPFSCDWKYL